MCMMPDMPLSVHSLKGEQQTPFPVNSLIAYMSGLIGCCDAVAATASAGTDAPYSAAAPKSKKGKRRSNIGWVAVYLTLIHQALRAPTRQHSPSLARTLKTAFPARWLRDL